MVVVAIVVEEAVLAVGCGEIENKKLGLTLEAVPVGLLEASGCCLQQDRSCTTRLNRP